MKTKFNQIVNIAHIASSKSVVNIPEILALAKQEITTPSSTDKKKTLLLAIDVQNDFMEDIGSLAVNGSRKDVERLTHWMYTNLSKLTQVICSLDTHHVQQIFHPAYWKDVNGNAPTLFTLITAQDVKNGKWKTVNDEQERSLDYLENLEANGQKQLCIWPYHCLEGTYGAQLESEFVKMLYFHSALRANQPIFIAKGQNPYSEMYGIIKAEYDPTNYINTNLLETIAQYDEIYIAGEASSHCVLASVEQILGHFEGNTEITSRITILEDCMSPIAGFEDSTKQRFEELRDKFQIKIAQSTTITL